MTIKTAALRLARAVRDERNHRETPNLRLRDILDEEVGNALLVLEDAISKAGMWDGSEPCRACAGSGVLTSPVDSAPCPDCAATGKKGVLVHGVSA